MKLSSSIAGNDCIREVKECVYKNHKALIFRQLISPILVIMMQSCRQRVNTRTF